MRSAIEIIQTRFNFNSFRQPRPRRRGVAGSLSTVNRSARNTTEVTLMKVRISLAFQQYGDQELGPLAAGVIKGLTDNQWLKTLPIDLAVAQKALDEYNAALAANIDGGLTATATKNNKRAVLVDVLEKLAYYVQSHSNNDREILSSSGFPVLAPRNTAPSLPAKPSILSVENGNTTQLVVKTGRVRGALLYELRIASVDAKGTLSEWRSVGLFSKCRMSVTGLTPGTIYQFQIRCQGSAGLSDWSDPVGHVCW